MTKLSVGILGFGALGKHMYDTIKNDASVAQFFEISFVWNRSADVLEVLPVKERCDDLNEVPLKGADIVVEVCHPSISVAIATKAMANRGALGSVTITMKKHPAMINLSSAAEDAGLVARKEALLAIEADGGESVSEVLYEGPVRELCPMAPNNVNTMACCAMACHSLGFDGVVGRLVADASLTTHEIVIDVEGIPNPSTGQRFQLHLARSSPAPKGAVTSKATYGSFVESLRKCFGRGHGVHFV
eukprot:GSChrysophyteH1.ASY1.ANO1.2.1 assembled CDS